MAKRGKASIAVALVALVLLAAATIARCSVAHAPETGDGPEIVQGAESERQVGTSNAGAQAGAGVLDVLTSHAWQAEGDPSRTIAFKRGSFAETSPAGTVLTAMEVSKAGSASLDARLTRDVGEEVSTTV